MSAALLDLTQGLPIGNPPSSSADLVDENMKTLEVVILGRTTGDRDGKIE